MSNLAKVFIPHLRYRLRTIAKRPILFGMGNCYELNEVAVHIWQSIDGINSVEDIINELVTEYACSREQVEKDVHEFIDFLVDKSAIEEVVSNE